MLKNRVLFSFGAISSILLIIFSLSFNYFLNKSINNNIKTKLKYIANDTISTNINIHNNIGIAIYKNKKIINQNSKFDLKDTAHYLNSSQKFFIIQHIEDDDYIDALYIKDKQNYKILVFKKNIDNKIENFQDILLFLVPILLLVLLFLASRMIDKVLLPIQELTKATQNISISDFSKNIPLPKENDEIKELVISFNQMIDRLREGVDRLDRFNSDVSHELKTPLTVIKGEIEITLRRAREPQVYQESMRTILNQSQQIQNIVEQLLILTKYSKDTIKESFQICSLDSILLTVIDKFEGQLKEKNLSLIIEKIESISINANSLLINSIFSNLLDNAIKYTPTHKNITISLYRDKSIYFTIKDEGVGISPEQLSKVTDRFYRVDVSRNKEIKGFGLGLSIVKNGVELHGGELIISSIKNEGLMVQVEFPN